jgi:hypothetical protein
MRSGDGRSGGRRAKAGRPRAVEELRRENDGVPTQETERTERSLRPPNAYQITKATPYFGDPRINDRGDVVAASWLYANGRGYAPSDLITDKNIQLSSLDDIHSSGQILGISATGEIVLLTPGEPPPIPEPRLTGTAWLLFSSSALPGYIRENRTLHAR